MVIGGYRIMIYFVYGKILHFRRFRRLSLVEAGRDMCQYVTFGMSLSSVCNNESRVLMIYVFF